MSTGQQDQKHLPVLPDKIPELLSPQGDGCYGSGRYLDGTVGPGGHTRAIADRLDSQGRILALDRDDQALALAREHLKGHGDKIHFARGVYSRFQQSMAELGWDSLDGALLDLGVSSLQLDQPERGFSFLHDGPLDMRMGPAHGDVPAHVLVNTASRETLQKIIGKYGEEPLGGRIARAIVTARARKPLESTLELARVVEQAYPVKMRAKARNHPATRTFQALRMAVNRELEELEIFLENIAAVLRPGARVAVISFHSLEDRLVKHAFRAESRDCVCPHEQAVCLCDHRARLRVLTRRPVMAEADEVSKNPRARSAKLRVAQRLPVLQKPQGQSRRMQ